MKMNETIQQNQGLSPPKLICNQGVTGSIPVGGTNKNNGLRDTSEKSRTGSRTGYGVYYLEAWGKSWRIVDVNRGWGYADSVCVCSTKDDALLILDLLTGGRG